VYDHPIPWRSRMLALYAALRMLVTGRHVYLSTGCLAGRHAYCAAMTGQQGAKRPARSKFSDEPCICWCHEP
jgi:hypothetical protein